MEDPIQSNIPAGFEHLEMVSVLSKITEEKSEKFSKDLIADINLLGDSMHAIYLSSTCTKRCGGGSHYIEYFGARVYNLSAASYKLIFSGYYDEAQSLIRSIGEISNLMSLAVCDPELFSEWISSDKQKRITKFSPAKVRKMVEKSNGVLHMNKDTYSKLCEEYTHLIPHVNPNNYDHSRNVCGGIAQKTGFEKSINTLSYLVSMLALFFCIHSGLDEESKNIEDVWRKRASN